jgi:hypothetical protein
MICQPMTDSFDATVLSAFLQVMSLEETCQDLRSGL